MKPLVQPPAGPPPGPQPVLSVREQVVHWGAHGHLAGIWTPAAAGVETRPVAVLFFNAGVIPRLGAHRINVKLSRALAAEGFACARFDLSGTGDSRPPREAGDYRTQAMRDIRAVIDALEHQHGIRRVALFGICSGAAHAQAVAIEDPRVCGVFLLDGYMYPTRLTRPAFLLRMLRTYGPMGFVSRAWRFLRRRRVAEAASGAPAADTSVPEGAVGEGLALSREAFGRQMQHLVDRGVGVTAMFTGSVLEYYAYARQLADRFAGSPWLGAVECLFAPEVDHTLTTRAAQRYTQERVLAWAERIAPRAQAPVQGADVPDATA